MIQDMINSEDSTKVSVAKDHGENYMKVRPPLIRYLVRKVASGSFSLKKWKCKQFLVRKCRQSHVSLSSFLLCSNRILHCGLFSFRPCSHGYDIVPFHFSPFQKMVLRGAAFTRVWKKSSSLFENGSRNWTVRKSEPKIGTIRYRTVLFSVLFSREQKTGPG